MLDFPATLAARNTVMYIPPFVIVFEDLLDSCCIIVADSPSLNRFLSWTMLRSIARTLIKAHMPTILSEGDESNHSF